MVLSVDELQEARLSARSRELHPESLLRIPLVMDAFTDTSFRLIKRATDARWTYAKLIPMVLSGFNPRLGSYFYAANSSFELWITKPWGTTRDLNQSDTLVREVLFMAHDYLHAWAYGIIDAAWPKLGFLSGEITRNNFEDFVFCHIMTEAVATVGLDYWCLSERDVNQWCDIGTCVGPLTVSYKESLSHEYRRFNGALSVQDQGFFKVLAVFYCSGSFPGFDIEDAMRSPQLLSWLGHELEYGVQQRILTRLWLASLGSEEIVLSEDRLRMPVEVSQPERLQLIQDLALTLWRKVRDLPDHDIPANIGSNRYQMSKDLRKSLVDFRFVNLSRLSRTEIAAAAKLQTVESRRYLCYQLLGQIPFNQVEPGRLGVLTHLANHMQVDLLLDACADYDLSVPAPLEPLHLFVAN